MKLAPRERDKLVEGNGKVAVTLSGVDFEFLEKVALESSARDAKPVEVGFTLPLGKRAGPQDSVTVNIDTPKQGSYRLLLTQSDGVAHEAPVTVLPPNPKISNLPIRLNMGETREAIRLQGIGWNVSKRPHRKRARSRERRIRHGWSGEIALKAGLVKGQRFPLLLKVKGLDSPVTVPDAIEIVGPRPGILSVQKSLTGALGIEIGADELPAGTAAGLVLTVNHLHDAVRPRLEVGLRNRRVAPVADAFRGRNLRWGKPDLRRTGSALSFGGPRRGWLCGVPPGGHRDPGSGRPFRSASCSAT